MKFTVIRENFTKGLSVVNKAVNPRASIPVLSNILIKTEKGRLKLNASDLQVTMSAWIGAKVDEEGEITIPAKVLTEFVTQVSDDKIECSLDGAILNVKTEKAKATFTGMNASEFPDIEAPEDGVELDIDSSIINEAISHIQFAAATDEGRPVLTGVLFKITGNTLVLATTDGFRMAEYRITLSTNHKDEIKCIVPAKALADVVKSFTPGSDKVKIIINNERNVVLVKVEDMEAQIRMIEGEYPDYEEVVPDDYTTEIFISKDELSNGIKLASIFARDTGNTVKLASEKGIVQASSQPSEAGSNLTEMNAEVQGEDIEIAFNAKYLLDLVNNVGSEELTFQAIESLKPGMFRLKDNSNYFYLVMPMKANW